MTEGRARSFSTQRPRETVSLSSSILRFPPSNFTFTELFGNSKVTACLIPLKTLIITDLKGGVCKSLLPSFLSYFITVLMVLTLDDTFFTVMIEKSNTGVID